MDNTRDCHINESTTDSIGNPDQCTANSEKTENITAETLSKRQIKKIKKREKWLKSKPEKRYPKYKYSSSL